MVNTKTGQAGKRVSLFATPLALLLAVAFVAVFYLATQPSVDPRVDGNRLWILALGLIALGMPAAAFWRNRDFFRDSPAALKSRAATLLVGETAGLVAALLVFANITAGGEEEASLREKVSQLILAGTDARRQVEAQVAQRGSLARVGERGKLKVGGSIGEAILGSNGAIIVYDTELRALAAMIPSARDKIVDWRLEGYPARSFPEHWRARDKTSFTDLTQGSPTDHSQALLISATLLQREISTEAKKRGSLHAVMPGQVLTPQGLLDFGYVDPDGMFALYSDRHGIFMLFEPDLQADGLVHWRCRVYPAEAAVPGCATGRQ
jgi:hypothetical protein